jgi:hypothetical protein
MTERILRVSSEEARRRGIKARIVDGNGSEALRRVIHYIDSNDRHVDLHRMLYGGDFDLLPNLVS